VAQLHGQKPFILNRTNQKSIERLTGSPYIEDWRDKDITLFATKTKVAKEVVECLRIRPTVTQRPKEKPLLSAPRFKEALERIKTGAKDEAFFHAHFYLSDEQKAVMRQEAEKMLAQQREGAPDA
jgi:hypothetical protein